jgi:hypothetical protein
VGGSKRQRIALSLAALAVVAGIAGFGTYATFTSTASQAMGATATGTVTIALGATGASTNRLNLGASGLAAGDTMTRSVDLSNTGNLDLASVSLTTSASPSSALDTDATNGLQLTITRCSQAWTESGSSPAFTYTCGGSQSTVLASQAVIGSNVALSNLTCTTAGNTDHLLVTLTLPSGAGNSMEGLSSTLTFAFTGTQRNATNK